MDTVGARRLGHILGMGKERKLQQTVFEIFSVSTVDCIVDMTNEDRHHNRSRTHSLETQYIMHMLIIIIAVIYDYHINNKPLWGLRVTLSLLSKTTK